MKTSRKTRKPSHRTESQSLTLGDLISATYNAVGDKGAPKILQLALKSRLVRLAQRPFGAMAGFPHPQGA